LPRAAAETVAGAVNDASAHRPAPTVSVILPTFNRLHFLRAAFESLCAQTFTDWELVVADDGSEPETRRYLRSLVEPGRVTILWLPHSGRPAVVRNAALRKARGKYVAFLDSDDLWTPNKLQRQIETLRARLTCLWSYTAFVRVDASGTPLPEETTRPWVPYEGEIFAEVVTGRASIRTPAVVATRQLIEQAGAFDEALLSAEDYDLWMRLALSSPVAIVDEPLVRVRYHDENHTRDWQSAYLGRDRSLRRHQELIGSRHRALLRRERMRNALKLAATHAELGERQGMVRALCQSLPYSWSYPQWWASGLKTVLRTQLPRRWLELYRNRRRDAS